MYCFVSFGVSLFNNSNDGSVGSHVADIWLQLRSNVEFVPIFSFYTQKIRMETFQTNFINILLFTISSNCISECRTCRPAATRTPKQRSINNWGPLSETCRILMHNCFSKFERNLKPFLSFATFENDP